jgi:IS5 family transposase
VHDAKGMDCLVRDDTAVYGDKGYSSDAKKRAAEAAGVLWAVKEKAKPGGRLTAPQVFSLLALANLCISPAGHLWLAALTRKSSLKPQTIASPR